MPDEPVPTYLRPEPGWSERIRRAVAATETLTANEQRLVAREHFNTVMDQVFIASRPLNLRIASGIVDELTKALAVDMSVRNEMYLANYTYEATLGAKGIARVYDLQNAGAQAAGLEPYAKELIETVFPSSAAVPTVASDITPAHAMECLDEEFYSRVETDMFSRDVTGRVTGLNAKFATVDSVKHPLDRILTEAKTNFINRYGPFGREKKYDATADTEFVFWMGVMAYLAGMELNKFKYKNSFIALSVLEAKLFSDQVVGGSGVATEQTKNFFLLNSWEMPLLSGHALGYWTKEQVRSEPCPNTETCVNPDKRSWRSPVLAIDPAVARDPISGEFIYHLRAQKLIDRVNGKDNGRLGAITWRPDWNRHYAKFQKNIMTIDPGIVERIARSPFEECLDVLAKKSTELAPDINPASLDAFFAQLITIGLRTLQKPNTSRLTGIVGDPSILKLRSDRTILKQMTGSDLELANARQLIRSKQYSRLISFEGAATEQEIEKDIARRLQGTIGTQAWDVSTGILSGAISGVIQSLGKIK